QERGPYRRRAMRSSARPELSPSDLLTFSKAVGKGPGVAAHSASATVSLISPAALRGSRRPAGEVDAGERRPRALGRGGRRGAAVGEPAPELVLGRALGRADQQVAQPG